MTAKEELSWFKKAKHLVTQLSNERSNELTNMQTALVHTTLRTHSIPSSDYIITAAQIIDIKKDLNQYTGNLIDLEQDVWDVFKVILQIPDLDEQSILIARYVNEKSWSDIAEEFGRSERWAHNLHNRALHSFEQISSNHSRENGKKHVVIQP